MGQSKLQEGTRLIARFEGWIDSPYEHLKDKMYTADLEFTRHLKYFNYHASWDALMPVIKNLRGIEYDYLKLDDVQTYLRHMTKISNWLRQVDIKETWNEVVELLKWYSTVEKNVNVPII